MLRAVEGSAQSAVRVVIYEDLACQDCAGFRRVMDETLLPRFGSTAAFEHHDFPLAQHVWARRAAIAARHFDGVEAGLGMAWRRFALENLHGMDDAGFPSWLDRFTEAQGAGAAAAARQALSDSVLAGAVDRDQAAGIALGVKKTPTVLANGVWFVERFPVEDLVKAIAEAVKERGQ
ncbi:MAG: thioredoxin domain-containing protein [Bryobacterales bacterium]|nr:thioredoxin domain-containing protein [Bryobacterales bacterium]